MINLKLSRYHCKDTNVEIEKQPYKDIYKYYSICKLGPKKYVKKYVKKMCASDSILSYDPSITRESSQFKIGFPQEIGK